MNQKNAKGFSRFPLALPVRRSLGEVGSLSKGASKVTSGFSLIELCITIALFALIATITFPSIWFLRRQQVISEVDKLFSVFSYLQQAAIASNKDLVLQFDAANNSYSFGDREYRLSAEASAKAGRENLSEHTKFAIKQDIKGPPSSPINALTKPNTFVNSQVVFYADGKMQPGTVYLTDSKKHYLYAITIPISQVSLIRKYKYTSKWLLLE